MAQAKSSGADPAETSGADPAMAQAENSGADPAKAQAQTSGASRAKAQPKSNGADPAKDRATVRREARKKGKAQRKGPPNRVHNRPEPAKPRPDRPRRTPMCRP